MSRSSNRGQGVDVDEMVICVLGEESMTNKLDLVGFLVVNVCLQIWRVEDAPTSQPSSRPGAISTEAKVRRSSIMEPLDGRDGYSPTTPLRRVVHAMTFAPKMDPIQVQTLKELQPRDASACIACFIGIRGVSWVSIAQGDGPVPFEWSYCTTTFSHLLLRAFFIFVSTL